MHHNILSEYFRLTTDIIEDEYNRLLESDIRQAHFVYAREIVRLYHGVYATEQAEQRYHSIASGNAPDVMNIITVHDEEISVVELLKQAGFASSNSDARRLINGGGIKLDGEKVSDSNLFIKHDAVLSRGKNRFFQIHFE